MSQTKVTDALRDVTAVDGAKITTGTIPEARITSLDATKLTGNIANARIPASAVTQHVTGYNDASIRADILKLALHQAIDGNRVAYNLEDSFIDGFEDDSGITTETTVDRNTAGEYVNTASIGTPAYVTGDRRSRITATTNYSLDQGAIAYLLDGAITSNFNGTDSILISGSTASTDKYFQFDFGSGNSIKVTEAKLYRNATSHHGQFRWQGSNDASSWTTIGADFQLGGSTPSTTLTTLSGNTAGYRYYRAIGVSGTVTATNWNQQMEFKEAGTIIGATGTLISDPQTASTSRTSASGVIIYEDAAGTNTLGTDLKIYFTANNGTNWTEASSYGTATTYSGTKKLVKLGATTVTAGSAIAMKAVWANQAEGAYVTGDRTSSITVSTNVTVHSGSGALDSTFVDGNLSNGWYFDGSTACAGKYIRFDWGSGNSNVFLEVQWTKDNASPPSGSHGNWKWQGSNNASDWTDIGGTFELNDQSSGAVQTQTTLSGNTTAYRYYQLLGVSGTPSSNQTQADIQFKTAGKEARLHGWAVNY